MTVTSRNGRHRSRWQRMRRRQRFALGVAGGTLLAGGVVAASFAAVPPTAGPAAGGTGTPAVPDPNCTLNVPADPLGSKGLATAYVLSATDPAQGPCREANAAQSAFVQATVVDTDTGAISIYNPLVIDQGSAPAIAPVVPVLPRHAVVGIWFGFNGDTLTLAGNTATGRCVNGSPGSTFGQFAYCNAPAFFTAANTAIQQHQLTVPPLGRARDGATCPSTRDFSVVDQDQSDNVTTDYLADTHGRTAQKTTANSATLTNSTDLLNGSDNLLLDAFIDPALGCSPWTAPDLADPGHAATSLALDELQAAARQPAPVALVPLNDPMVLIDNQPNQSKTDLYRAGVDQIPAGGAADGNPAKYCTNLSTVGASRIARDRQFTATASSPQQGQSLYDFLTHRLTASLSTLGCQQTSPARPTP
ncbi:hypothetical protein [Kitasatospora mediocidica]|uniref:hypothetical protein n=1 Tax=Kitasatospora mediocidica TaxID=58352 RepID=UPI0018DB6CDA|nr:hypothetical protein [Kitasatospora mediocidica]